MTRYEFLKSAGFTGGALMALLSCVKTEDMYVDALTQNPDGTTTTGSTNSSTSSSNTTGTTGTSTNGSTSGSTSGSTTSSSTSSTSADTSLFLTTTALNNISNVKVKIDISSSTYSKLKTRGGYVIINSTYVLALSKTGKYIAATVTCSHEPKKQVIYWNGEWYCSAHSARFSEAGSGLNSNGKKGLTIYKVATDGTTLVIY